MTTETSSETGPGSGAGAGVGSGSVPGRLRGALGIGAGNVLEGFDWGIYALFSPFFASQVFAGQDATADLLKTLAIFAVGFLARPVGGFAFGWLADRAGRRPTMALTIGLAGLGCLVIGLCPTHTQVGALAPVILLLARLLQGLAHGGELPTAQTYLTELAPRERRGLWSSLSYVSGSVGALGGTASGAVLASTLSTAQMDAWGWRLPFLLGALFGFYGLVMRIRLPESETFRVTTPADREVPIGRRFRSVPGAMARVIGLTVGITVVYYTWASNTAAYAISTRHIAPGPALWAVTGSLLVFMLALPAWGALSDRIGRRPALLLAGVPLTLLLVPLDRMVGHSAWALFAAASIALGLLASSLSVGIAVYAELFPTGIRAAGLGVPYSIAVAVFGGTAPYLQTFFGHAGHPGLFNGYSIVAMLVSLVTVALMPETRAADLSAVPSREQAVSAP